MPQPYYFNAANGSPYLTIAGPFDRWRDPENENRELLLFLVVRVGPVPLVEDAHWDQAPVLPPDAFPLPRLFNVVVACVLGRPAQLHPVAELALVERRDPAPAHALQNALATLQHHDGDRCRNGDAVARLKIPWRRTIHRQAV